MHPIAAHVMKAITALTLAGAATAAAQQLDRPPSGTMAGFAKYEFNKWLFRECPPAGTSSGTVEALPFIDATPGGMLFQAIQERWRQSLDPLRGVYVEISGYTETGRVTVTELQRALGWVESCAQRPTNVGPAVVLWAAGNEPSWVFVLEGGSARLQLLGEPALRFPAAVARSETALAIDVGPPSDRTRIEFGTRLCSDTMSEASFGRSVVVAHRGRLLQGCGFVR